MTPSSSRVTAHSLSTIRPNKRIVCTTFLTSLASLLVFWRNNTQITNTSLLGTDINWVASVVNGSVDESSGVSVDGSFDDSGASLSGGAVNDGRRQFEAPLSAKLYDESGHKIRQRLARAGLNHLAKSRAFDTLFTTQETVVAEGFTVSSWDPCTLERIYQANQQQQEPLLSYPSPPAVPLGITILGGSCTARAARNCSSAGPLWDRDFDEDDVLGGRFSNILEATLGSLRDYELNNDGTTTNHTLNVKVTNMGQGATSTTWSAMVMDEMIIPNQTDVLVWEYAVNDFWGVKGSRANAARSLGFWLDRVKSLFAEEGKPPPPVVLVFLWEYLMGDSGKKPYVLKNGLGQPAILAKKTIEYYRREEGWNIQTVNVGAVINRTRFVERPIGIFDDRHHPGCIGTHLIANMMQHTIYSDLSACTANELASTSEPPHSEIRHINSSNLSKEDDPFRFTGDLGTNRYMKELWMDVVRNDTRIGSITHWQPSTGAWGLNLANFDKVRSHPTQRTGKTSMTRRDRKYVFKLPRCVENKTLDLVLDEPDLRWLGIGVGAPKALGMRLNGGNWVNLTQFVAKNTGQVNIFDMVWIRISHLTESLAMQYNISLCNKFLRVGPNLNTIIGVMHPIPP